MPKLIKRDLHFTISSKQASRARAAVPIAHELGMITVDNPINGDISKREVVFQGTDYMMMAMSVVCAKLSDESGRLIYRKVGDKAHEAYMASCGS